MNYVISRRNLLAWIITVLFLAACIRAGQETEPPSSTPSFDWYQVYFTDPESPKASTLRGGPDAALAESIYHARLSVDLAADNLNLWSLRDALLAAHRRGVDVPLHDKRPSVN